MRITDRARFESARVSTANAREASQEAQQLVSRGTRIQHPGDDPAGAGMMVAFQMSGERLAAIAKGTATASDELGAADTALGSISTALSRARELTMQLSSAGYTPEQRALGAQEVGGLFDQIIAALNTRVGNRYLFGGTRDRSLPFQPDGTYAGNDAVRTVEIAPGIWQPASVRADVAMGVPGAGGTDVLAALKRLKQALATDDAATARSTLDDLDAAIDQVSTARAETGKGMNVLDAAGAAAKIAASDDETRAAKQGEVDLAEAAIRMQAAQNALEAALAAAAQSFRISLLDYLR